MDVGDKVKKVKGNPFGIVGTIKSKTKISRLDKTVNGQDIQEVEWNYYCQADDGTGFSGFEDELELL